MKKNRLYGYVLAVILIVTSCKENNNTNQKNTSGVVNDVEELIIKRKNNKDLVLIPLDEYNSLKETSYLLSGKNRDVLLNSIKELEAGKGIEKDLYDL